MKISDRDKKLLLIIFLLAIVLLPIFLFIKPTIENTKSLQTELDGLAERYEYLKALSEKQPFYEAEIARLDGERDGLIGQFAEGLRQENTIMFLRDIELNYPIIMTTETFAGYAETPITDGYINENGELEGDLTALTSSTTVTYVCGYDQIKNLLDFIFTYKDKMSIPAISISYDPAFDTVSGSFVLDEYAIVGSGRSVDQVKLPSIQHGGNETIFAHKIVISEEAEELLEDIIVDALETE